MNSQNICILGSGPSIDKISIPFDKYDLVCGLNRVYTNDRICKHIDLFFSNGSEKDPLIRAAQNIFKINNNAVMIYLPGNPDANWGSMQHINTIKKKYGNENVFVLYSMRDFLIKHDKCNYFSGILALWLMCILYPRANIDVYGYDFYRPGIMYAKGIDKFHGVHDHNIKKNISKLSWLMNNHNVRWITTQKVLMNLLHTEAIYDNFTPK